MAIVIHTIHGDKYAYDHYREGGKVQSKYLGKFEVSTQHGITNGFIKKPGYKERHAYANKREREDYPETFDKLMAIINKRLGKDELAGKYSGEKIIINSKIPNTYHDEIRDHELYERQYHREKYPEVPGAK